MKEEKNLSELIFESNYKPVIHVENVKEKIQKVQGRLNEEFDWTNIKDNSGCWSPGQVKLKIEKIFKEEFGKRLI